LTVRPTLFKERAFDTLEQLEPVIWLANTPGIIVVRNELKANDVVALIALSRASPDSLSMASAGAGSIQHPMGAYFDRLGEPYRGQRHFGDAHTGVPMQ
jgi:tripartite-type tricarboxylate transporter receptor subunit TctC